MSNLAEVCVDIFLLLSRDLRVVDLLTVDFGHLNPNSGIKHVPVHLRGLLRHLGVSWSLKSQITGFTVNLKDSIPLLLFLLTVQTKFVLATSSFDRSRLLTGRIEGSLLVHWMTKDLSLLRLLKCTLYCHLSSSTSHTDCRLT